MSGYVLIDTPSDVIFSPTIASVKKWLEELERMPKTDEVIKAIEEAKKALY